MKLTEEQVDKISRDITDRGIGMEDLHDSLLDHVCCILESELREGDDFDLKYKEVIQRFYTEALWEIEEQTISMLIFKNQHIMKKAMLISGLTAATTLCSGLIFKFMHWPGATMLLVIAICTISFVFLPLLFTLKIKEQESTRSRVVLFTGSLLGILISLHILFKIMHWPGTNILFSLSVAGMLGVFIPLYFFTGIRNKARKTDTIVVTLIMVLASALFLTPYSSSRAIKREKTALTQLYVSNESLLSGQHQLLSALSVRSEDSSLVQLSDSIYRLCTSLKSFILRVDAGVSEIGPDFSANEVYLQNTYTGDQFEKNERANQELEQLQHAIAAYNRQISEAGSPALSPLQDITGQVIANRSSASLLFLSQLQALVMQNRLAREGTQMALKN